MMRSFSVLMTLCLLPVFAAQAETPDAKAGIEASSDIKAVTVYSNRAKVTRVAVVEVPKGAHSVIFKNLPAALLPDSLRAEGSADADVKIGAVAAKEVMSSELASPRENEINTKLEGLQDQLAQVNAEKAAAEAEKKFYENIGQQATLRANENLAQMDIKPEQWSGAGQTLHASLGNVLKAEVGMDAKIREINRDVEKTQGELDQLRTDQRSSFQVTVPVEAAASTKLTLSLSYQVPDATWKPLYDARLDTAGEGKLALVQYGSVSQRTGEDWDGVALTLSTAQPQRGAGLPDLAPLWIDSYQMSANNALSFKDMSSNVGSASGGSIFGGMQQQASNMAQSMPASPPAGAPAEMKKAEPKAASFVTAEINAGGFMSEYKIPGPSSVPADGTDSRLMVGTFDTQSKIEIHVKPQLSSEAFLVAKCKLRGEAPILPGQVNLFRDGAFVGQATLPLLRPDEEHGLYFGVDDQVSVKRKVLKDQRAETGVITHDNVLERAVVTEIQNLHKQPVDVVVKETVPASRNEKIHVEIQKGEATTPDFEEDAANIKGLLTWSFKMAPKEKKNVKLGWTVSWPGGETLTGIQLP